MPSLRLVLHFRKVTTSYGDGLFQCYQVKDLPHTNNDLEQYFGTARHVERRVTGRKRASPTLVVRGSVRVMAAGASRLVSFSAADLQLTDVAVWQALRQTLNYRHEGRRRQLRFRRDPQAYLASLEQHLPTGCATSCTLSSNDSIDGFFRLFPPVIAFTFAR